MRKIIFLTSIKEYSLLNASAQLFVKYSQWDFEQKFEAISVTEIQTKACWDAA